MVNLAETDSAPPPQHTLVLSCTDARANPSTHRYTHAPLLHTPPSPRPGLMPHFPRQPPPGPEDRHDASAHAAEPRVNTPAAIHGGGCLSGLLDGASCQEGRGPEAHQGKVSQRTAISWLAWPAQSPGCRKRAGTGPSKDKVLALKVQKGPWGEEQAGPGPDMDSSAQEGDSR